jgi:hypothetical protein
VEHGTRVPEDHHHAGEIMAHCPRFHATSLLLWLLAALYPFPAHACCPAPPNGKPVVNADQTVILLWDPVTKTEHFIRKASFRAEADDFGFIVPTPSRPELSESGDEAFAYLARLTAPDVVHASQHPGMGCGCAAAPMQTMASGVVVLEEKDIAGFHATVLEANSAGELVDWLNDHGYAFSPAVRDWAAPYVGGHWKFTAMKMAKANPAAESVGTRALRITFKTDRPLFPYREPNYRDVPASLTGRPRLLRIFFLADARYSGELTPDQPWTGRVAWAGKIDPESRSKTLELLNIHAELGAAPAWLTEFEDPWPYRVAPADVYFSRADDQHDVRRPAVGEGARLNPSTDMTPYALGVLVALAPIRRLCGKRSGRGCL